MRGGAVDVMRCGAAGAVRLLESKATREPIALLFRKNLGEKMSDLLPPDPWQRFREKPIAHEISCRLQEVKTGRRLLNDVESKEEKQIVDVFAGVDKSK